MPYQRNAVRCMALTLTLTLAVLAVSSAAASALHGSVATPCKDNLASLSVVAVSAGGAIVAEAPVRSGGDFTLHGLLSRDGVADANNYYSLHLLGAVQEEYSPIIIHVTTNGSSGPAELTAAYQRNSSLSRLVSRNPPDRPLEVRFKARWAALYAAKRAPFRWRNIFRYKMRIFQAVALLFVVWFPRFIRDLPKEMREELTGEKEPDLGDPNKLVKDLLGREQETETRN